MRATLLILALSASAASAEVARVKGGEHPEFTRVVIEANGAGDWRFGRTDDGYELALGPEVTGFDLSQAFDKIPRDRVSGLWRDPDSGRLRLALSCPCHAIAFEFRPGIIVVDIKTGPAPEGTAFEAPIEPPAPTAERSPPEQARAAASGPDPERAADTGPGTAPEPAAKASAAAYDWLSLRADEANAPDPPTAPAPTSPLAEASAGVTLAPLREALLQQISRGVAQGVVEIAEPATLPESGDRNRLEREGVRISVGDIPGVKAATVRDPDAPLSATGLVCPPDTALAIADWGLPGPPAEQFGPGRSGLLAEFDAPVEPAVLRAARTYVALGFGAEARQFLDFLPTSEETDRAFLRALTHLVDLEPARPNPFKGLEGCDTAAALWSAVALAADGQATAADVAALDKAAVARSFSALPVHLRRHLGPALVNLLLSQGDEETARRLRDATLRAPGEGGPEVTLMDADYHLATGKDDKAGALADTVLNENGPGREDAAVTRVEAAFQGDRAVPADLPEALAAYRQDARGTEDEARLARALILAAAMAGDFETAFATLPDAPGTAADLWTLAVEGVGDGLFLERAVAAAAAVPPDLPPGVALAVALRLEDLGFAAEALAWLGPIGIASPEEARLLAAKARLRMQDARAAVTALSGMTSPEAESLRAVAILQLGDAAGAVKALDRAGDSEARVRAEIRTKDWSGIAETGPEAWKAAAGLVAPVPNPAEAAGPITRGTALVEESAGARATIKALLDATPAPEAGP